MGRNPVFVLVLELRAEGRRLHEGRSFAYVFQSDPAREGESYERREPWHCVRPDPDEIARARRHGRLERYTIPETGGGAADQK